MTSRHTGWPAVSRNPTARGMWTTLFAVIEA